MKREDLHIEPYDPHPVPPGGMTVGMPVSGVKITTSRPAPWPSAPREES